jgi:hypothetical protein
MLKYKNPATNGKEPGVNNGSAACPGFLLVSQANHLQFRAFAVKA